MVKKNKGLLKKIGCILISASILLTGWTFFGSSISIADGDTTIVDEVLNEDPDTTEEDVEEVAEAEETEESEDAADTSEETTTTFSTDSLELYSLPAAALGASLASTNDDGTYTADDGATYSDSSMTVLVKVPASVGSTFSVPSSVSTIKSGAFDGSNVTDLTFASDATIGTHSSWPANGTVVHAEALSSTSEVVTYFEKLIKAGRNVKILFDESSTTTYSITFEYYKDSISTANKIGTETEEYDEDDDLELPDTIKTFNSVSYNYVSGPTPDFETVTADATYSFIYTEATTYDITYNYVLQDSTGAETGTTKTEIVKVVEGETPSMPATTKTFDGTTYTYVSGPTPTFAAATANAEYSFVYKASSSQDDPTPTPSTPTYTVTIKGNFYENDGTTYIGERTITSYTQEAGKVITAPTVDGYTAFGTTTYTVTASNSQTATFTYKKTTASSSSTKKFKVTVYDVFYDQTMTKKIETKTRQTDTYSQGDTFSYDPKTYSGYEYVSAENQSGTVNADRTVTFKYKATTASGKTTSNSKYSVTAGANQKVPSNVGTVTITCDGPLDKIVAIKVDGVTLAQNQFTVESGSTILTLTASYVSSLSAGDHVVRFEYTDGWAETLLTITGKTTTTVTYKVSSDGSISSGHTKDTTPTTADGFDSRYLLCLAIFLLGAGTILFSKQKKLEAILAGDRDDE